MFRYIKVTQKGLILVLLPLIFSLLFVLFLAQQLASTADRFDKLKQSQRVLYKLNARTETVLRSAMLVARFQTISDDERSNAVKRVKAVFADPKFLGDLDIINLSEIRELFPEVESSRKMALAMCQRLESNKSAHTDSNPMGMTNKDRDEAVMITLNFRNLLDRLKSLTTTLESTERGEIDAMFTQLVVLLLAGFSISCALSFLLAYVFTVDIVRRLNVIRDKAYLVAAGRELPRPQEGTDEIAELDIALHRTSLKLTAFQKKELAILNNAADVVCSLDRQLRVLAIGESCERVWGHRPDDLLGRSIKSILTSDTADDASDKFESIAAGGDTTVTTANTNVTAVNSNVAAVNTNVTAVKPNVTAIVKCKNGTLMDTSWTINWSDETQDFVCVAHDVTELRKIEKLKQAFFSMVSHDLRAPLTSINVNLANMTSGVDGQIPEGAEKIMKNAVASTERLTALVNDLLELDRLDSGKLVLELECISLRDVLESSVVALESMASTAGVEVGGPSGDAAVMADEKRLIQVFTNLISNAIKFSPKGAKVEIKIRRKEGLRSRNNDLSSRNSDLSSGKNDVPTGKNDVVEVTITDQGEGIPPDQQSQLFDKYTQGSATSNVAIRGTGLGLAIVKSIVTAHDGEVGVTSEPGKGSTFWVRLKEFTD